MVRIGVGHIRRFDACCVCICVCICIRVVVYFVESVYHPCVNEASSSELDVGFCRELNAHGWEQRHSGSR
jgi:hypothetical protein